MSTADVNSSIEKDIFREAQARENCNSNGKPIDCSAFGDKPVIKANNEADSQALRDCFKE